MFNVSRDAPVPAFNLPFAMFAVPEEMRVVNSYVECEIPSAKDLYEKMGFRYVTGLGHNSVDNAKEAMYAATPRNSAVESLYGVDNTIAGDIDALANKEPAK